MITKAKILQSLLLALTAASLVNCSPAVPCNVVGNNARGLLRRAGSPTNICGNGGGGGGGGCSSTLTPTQVMLSVDVTGKVLEYGIATTTGVLTLMCNTATAAAGPLAVSANKFLYVLDNGSSATGGQIFGFTIVHGLSGALAPISGQPFSFADPNFSPASSIASDPLGRFLYVTNLNGGDVHVFIINQTTGGLTEATNSPFTFDNFSPENIAIMANGKFAYVPDVDHGEIFIFSVGSTGQLTPTTTGVVVIPNNLDFPQFALMHPTLNFLFTANVESLASWVADPTTGDLTLANGTTVSTGGFQVEPISLALDGTNTFLYVTPLGANGLFGNTSNAILGYQVATTQGGGLTIVPNAPFASTSTLDVIANPLAQQLYVFSATTVPTIVVFTAPIDVSGNLTIPATGLTVAADFPPVIANIQ
jgi:6-phosphogluconolactonase (cycloisomerase 2 family)